MARSLALLQRFATAPFDADTTRRRLDLTIANASIALAAGLYTIVNDGTTTAILRHGAAAAVPASGDPAVAGYPLTGGAAVQVMLDADTTLHAIMVSGTATLWCIRQVP